MMESKNKICLITGFTSGIGKAASEKFAFGGCRLLLVARSRHRGERIAEEIALKTGNDNIKLFTADLSSIDDVYALSEKIHKETERIDVLVNCAGAYFSKYHETIDGIEASFAVDYLSRFLLTNLLLDLMNDSHPARIIEITGESHRKGKLLFPLKKMDKYSASGASATAKLADMIFVKELSERLKGKNISINALHPGAIATNIIKNDPDSGVFLTAIYSLVSLFFHKPAKAAEEIFYLAFSKEVENLTGKYFCGRKATEPLPLVYDKNLAGKLWLYSEELTKLKLRKLFNQSLENK